MSNRVQFVTDSGTIFFECHPAEARFAKKAIEHQRANDLIPLEEKPYIETFPKVLAANPEPQGIWTGGFQHCLADLYAGIEEGDFSVTHLLMSAYTYSEIRKFDRDILDLETKAVLLRTGLMATLWGAKIFITNKVLKNIVIAASHPDIFIRHNNDNRLIVHSFEYRNQTLDDGEVDFSQELTIMRNQISKIEKFLSRKRVIA